MKLSKKVLRLATPRPNRNLRKAILRRLYPLNPQTFLSKIDSAGLAHVSAHYADATVQLRIRWPKYLQVDVFLRHSLRNIHELGLHRCPRPLRILDLGSGLGYFLFVCKEFGHDGLGLDLAHPLLYADLFGLLGLQCLVWQIKPLKPLPEMAGRKYDLVTACAVNFHRRSDETTWNAAEWKFILEDLRRRFVAPGGMVHLDLNRGPNGVHMAPGVEK